MNPVYSWKNTFILAILLFGGYQYGNAQIVVTNTNDNGAGSLRDAVNSAIFGDVITFNPGIAGQVITLDSIIYVTTTITIDGQNNNMILSGGGSSRIFNPSGAGTFNLNNITLTNGAGSGGAAMYSTGGVDINATNVIFRNNNSFNDGGAVRALGGTQNYTNCQFIGNNAPAWGGGYYQLFGTTNFVNCLFSGNRGANGGALFVRGTSTIINCTFSGNRANNATGGGALYLFNGANVQIGNSIFWNNQSGSNIGTQEAFYTMDSGSPTFFGAQDCIIEGSGGSGTWNAGFGVDGGGNIDADPLFANQISPASAPTTGGNYRPQLGSPAHDNGDDLLNSTANDLDGHNRIIYSAIDIGAYEFCTTTSTINQTVCDSYNSPAGNVYTTTGTYYDTLTNYLGCDSVITINLIVDHTAVVDAGPDQFICAENPVVTLAGGVLNAGGGNWSGGIGTYNPNSSTLNADYTLDNTEVLATTLTLTLTSTGNGACPAVSDDMTITVNPSPSVSAGLDQTVCQGTAVTLSGSGTAISYTWDNGVTDGSPFTPGVGTVTYTVTGVDGNGCQATDQVDVTVVPNPLVTLTSSDGDNINCDGDLVTFTAANASDYEFFINGFSVQGPSPANTFNTSTLVNGDSVSVHGTSAGCTSAAPQTYVFTVNSLPAVSFSPLSDMCQNDAPYALVEGTPPGGNYSGTGISANTFTPSSVAPGSYTLTYDYTDGNGCSNSAIQNINVLAIPIVTGTGTTSICEGQSTTISANGANTYSWDQGIGNGQTHIVTPSTTTSYAVTGTAGNGCQNSDTVTITVNPLPTVTFGAIPDICADGAPYTFVEGTPAGGTYSGPGVSAGQISQGVAGVGTHWIYYSYTDGFGCTNIDSNTILIYNSPTVVANATDTELCVGESLTLSGSGASSYSWSNGVSDGVPFNPTVGTYNYVVSGIDGNGCGNTDSVEVTVHGLPTVIAGADQTVCEGTAVSLNGSGADTYSWDNGASDGVSFIPPVGTNIYIVTGTDANGCQNTDTTSVTVNPNPILTVSPDLIFCLGDSIVLTASGASTYDWDSGASSNATYLFFPTQSGTSTVVGYSSAGCSSSENVNYTLDDPSSVDAGIDQTICVGFTTYLSSDGGTNYVWNGPGIDNENNQDISFTVDTSAYYYVTVTTYQGCVYTDSVYITANSDPSCSIETVTSITPNDDGVNDTWRIIGIEAFPDNTVTIFNRWGDIVYQEDNYDNDLVIWDGMLNGKKLGAGTYFYVIEIVNGPKQSGWVQLMK